MVPTFCKEGREVRSSQELVISSQENVRSSQEVRSGPEHIRSGEGLVVLGTCWVT